MEKQLDCIVCGSCTVDILVRPVALDQPIGAGVLHRTEPIELTTGGLTSNAGIAMSQLGLRVGMLSYTGQDAWSRVMRERYREHRIDTSRLLEHPELPSSSTVVFTDPSGERSFAHHQGAPRLIDREMILGELDWISQSRYFLIGYYSLLPNVQDDLPEIFAAIREAGCKTAMDAAGSGGELQPLDRILPHLDVYMPSLSEAQHQTGETDPERILEIYRECGAPGIIGVKLGSEGALLQGSDRLNISVPAVKPPGPVVDTTGAGDSFYSGLLTGLVSGMTIENSARLAAAAGACCVTGFGATSAIRDFEETASLAEVEP